MPSPFVYRHNRLMLLSTLRRMLILLHQIDRLFGFKQIHVLSDNQYLSSFNVNNIFYFPNFSYLLVLFKMIRGRHRFDISWIYAYEFAAAVQYSVRYFCRTAGQVNYD